MGDRIDELERRIAAMESKWKRYQPLVREMAPSLKCPVRTESGQCRHPERKELVFCDFHRCPVPLK